ncbi:MAG: glycosyltransferase family 4 protein [Thermodesulfobacteriota bacterium]
MHIGLVIYGSLATLTGGYLYDRLLAEQLASRGHRVTVLSLPVRPYPWRLLDNRRRCPPAGEVDLFLEDELCHPSLLRGNPWQGPGQRAPRVAVVHQVLCDEPRPAWRNRLYALAERRYLAAVDGFVFNSQTTATTVASLVAGRRPSVIASPAGDRLGSPLDEAAVTRRAQASGPLALLFLGNVMPRKGLLPLLSALALVPEPIWRLTVVGSLAMDPGYARRVRGLAERSGLGGRVAFCGPLAGDALARVLAASHLLCMPFAYEGFGIVLLEAMAFGLPVLASMRGAARETVTPGRNGFLLAPADGARLAGIIRQLAADRSRLADLAVAALAHFRRQPGWQAAMARVAGFLEGLRHGPR